MAQDRSDRLPWLIKNFIDPGAEFAYVPAGEVLAVAEREAPTLTTRPGPSTHTATASARSRC